MNDYYAMERIRLDREQAARSLRNAQHAQATREAGENEEARPRWPRFSLMSMIARLLPKTGGTRSPQALPPCGDTPLSAR
jgi:hypothetical protein